MGGAVKSVLGGGSDKAAKAQEKAAKEAAKQFAPFNVNSTLGTAKVSGRNLTFALSGGFQNLLDQEQALGALNPEEVAQQRYNMLSEFSAQDEADTRRTTRERLFRSGRLGTAGGIREIGEVEEALARARLDRQVSAWGMAERQRQNAISNAINLGQLDLGLGTLAVNRTPSIVGAGYMNAGNTQAAGDLAMRNAIFGPAINKVGSAFGNALGSGLSSLGSRAAYGMAGYFGSALPAASFGGTALTGAQVATAFSDRRLKKNIRPERHDGRLQWYRYEFKDPDQYGHGEFIGVMADEVEQVIPEAVSIMGNGYKAVDYGRIQ